METEQNQESKDCIFCKMVAGEVPCHKVYEDENFLAFLDINPLSPGHTQVIPKQHFRYVWDVPNAGDLFKVAKKVATAQQKAFKTDWILSRIVGDEVHHAHIWVYPNSNIPGDKKDFEGNLKVLKESL